MGDDELRRKYKLPPKERTPRLDDSSQYSSQFFSPGADYITFSATVSTVPDQIAMAPGYLQKEWTEGRPALLHVRDERADPGLLFVPLARYTVSKPSGTVCPSRSCTTPPMRSTWSG
jgi:ABC-2 type transport system permease protein